MGGTDHSLPKEWVGCTNGGNRGSSIVTRTAPYEGEQRARLMTPEQRIERFGHWGKWEIVKAFVADAGGSQFREGWGSRRQAPWSVLKISHIPVWFDHPYCYTDREGERVWVSEPYGFTLNGETLAHFAALGRACWWVSVSADGGWFPGRTVKIEMRRHQSGAKDSLDDWQRAWIEERRSS